MFGTLRISRVWWFPCWQQKEAIVKTRDKDEQDPTFVLRLLIIILSSAFGVG
jgi:hypothetical protein